MQCKNTAKTMENLNQVTNLVMLILRKSCCKKRGFLFKKR